MRFPHIGEKIFEELDNKSLAMCRRADRSWKTFIDDQKFSWIRKIRFCSIDSKEPLEKILKKTKLDIVKELAEEALGLCFSKFDDNKEFELHRRKAGHILYFAARIGHEDFFREENISKFNEKNPYNLFGHTPLHFAAQNGHLSICQLIIEHFDDKNPRDDEWLTPLHLAAENGNLAICQLIIENFKDTYPKGLWGISPFHESPYEKAKASGHSNICKLFDENIDFKIRRDKRGPNFWLGPNWWM